MVDSIILWNRDAISLMECGMMIYTTNEGVYLSRDAKAKYLPRAPNWAVTNSFLTLSEMDKNKWSFMNKLLAMDKKICSNFLSVINVMKSVGNGFFSVFDTNGNKVTLENKDGVIYIPDCEPIPSIVIDKTNECYQDIPISFVQNNKTTKGFLTKSYIIVRASRIVDCSKMRS